MAAEMSHDVLGTITLTPLSEAAAVNMTEHYDDEGDRYVDWREPLVRASDYRRSKMRLEWDRRSFEVVVTMKPSKRKQKLIDAGFEPDKADKILDVLGEL